MDDRHPNHPRVRLRCGSLAARLHAGRTKAVTSSLARPTVCQLQEAAVILDRVVSGEIHAIPPCPYFIVKCSFHGETSFQAVATTHTLIC